MIYLLTYFAHRPGVRIPMIYLFPTLVVDARSLGMPLYLMGPIPSKATILFMNIVLVI
jgi:hypothetical protein